jgi:hypothetical protein
MVAKQLTKAERLAKLRQQLADTDVGSGNAGFIGSLPEGVTVLRILPEVGDMPRFYQEVGIHQMPGKNGKRIYCPKFTSRGKKDCPVCSIVDQLYQAGDEASKAFAGQIRCQKKYWMNTINRAKENDGPKIYTPGVLVFRQLSSLIQDKDYGDVTDVEVGYDIKVSREGKGKTDTDYQARPAKMESPLSDDEDKANEWLEQAKDLSYVEVNDNPDEDAELSEGHAVYILPYDRLVKELDLDNLEMTEGEEDDEKEDERPARKPSKKVVEEEDEVVEEEEVHKPTHRVARPSTRR